MVEVLDSQARALHGTQAQGVSDFRKRAIAIVGLHLQALGREEDYIHVAVVVEVGECSAISRDRTGGLARSSETGLSIVGQQRDARAKYKQVQVTIVIGITQRDTSRSRGQVFSGSPFAVGRSIEQQFHPRR